MVAANAYRFKTASWKGSTITGVKGASDSESAGGKTEHRTDNATTIQAIFLDSISGTVKITTTDQSLRGAANYALGSNGILILTREQRAEGKGAVGGADKTVTANDATLVDIQEGIPIGDTGTLELTFNCVDGSGVAVFVHT